jgi:hypothetical protein
VLLPPDVVGADVCAKAIAAVKHTMQASMSAGLFMMHFSYAIYLF